MKGSYGSSTGPTGPVPRGWRDGQVRSLSSPAHVAPGAQAHRTAGPSVIKRDGAPSHILRRLGSSKERWGF